MFKKKVISAKKAKELTKRGADRKFKARIKEVIAHINNYIEISAMQGDTYTIYYCDDNGTLPMTNAQRIQEHYCALGYKVDLRVEEGFNDYNIYSRYIFVIDWSDYND